MSAIVDYWTRRLEDWATWTTSGGASHISTVYRGPRVDDDTPPRPPMPLIGQATDTDALVLRLSPTHQTAIRATFCWTGTLTDRAGALRISADTLRNRVKAACFALDDLHHARRKPATRVQRTQPNADVPR